ncbi:MAG: anti-sigma factor family protein [Bryobacteraceae bacterium]
MSCVIDLKAYALGEMDRRESTSVDEHVHACDSCREELERLDLTKVALASLSDEEIPRRIAFVSDSVFEPRWWQRIWHSGPVMGFASALVLAAAILVHGAIRPVSVPAPAPVPPAMNVAGIQQQMDARVDAAVAKAVAESEQRQAAQNAQLLDAAEKRFTTRHHAEMVTAQETIRMYQQQAGRMLIAYNNSQSGTQQ